MRKINKQTPLANFNGTNYNNDCTDWKCFHEKYKSIFQDARLQILMDEQNNLCGYTELYINNEEECHIDHYKKRSHYLNLTFDWNNLIVATKDTNFGANYKDNTYSIQRNYYPQIYNPVIDNIPFEYNEWGGIIEEEGKIKNTVEVFNLNCKSLKRRREDIMLTIKALKESGENIEDIKISLEDTGFKSVIEQELKD